MGWHGSASSDLDMLLESYSLFGGKFKDNEIGVLTGLSFIVVDGNDGKVEGMSTTPYYNIQSRGFQYLVVRNIPKEKLGIPVDIKGLGGLAILPLEFNNREWVLRPDEVEIADCAEWLLEKIQNHMNSKESYRR